MKLLSSDEIRNIWIDFFTKKKHSYKKGVSLIPYNDPSLLWINSGVAGLKKYFDGREIPKDRRIVNIQKSIRTNDIENVGKTSRHHTFFEMLGNFSIGDYFRNEAIEFAYELLTNEDYFGIPKKELYITYYIDDLETKKKWLSLGIEESHIIPNKDNFWEIGEGPCGPNTEIFFDRGEKYDEKKYGSKLLIDGIENERFIEIWNIVFSQFNAKNGVERENYLELPSKNIDTGAGLERLACIFQNKETNFETDLFMPIIKKIESLTGIEYRSNKLAFRVISDHLKACVFALSDGAIFSNEKNGYVLRRLLRRAMVYGHELNMNRPFIFELVDDVCKIYINFYPELNKEKESVKKSIKNEEEKFLKTLIDGKNIFQKMVKENNIDAFKLYDTYGFPIDLTIEMAKKENLEIDLRDFELKMQQQKDMSRKNIKKNEANEQSKDLLSFQTKSEFIYEDSIIEAKILEIFKNGKIVEEIVDSGEIIFDKTNFYAESGGQINDIGEIENEYVKCKVEKVIKAPNGQHLHFIKILNGKISKSNNVFFSLKIDKKRRDLISYNHSATHLLQSALNELLSKSIEQKGSYVSDKCLHFDFNYNKKIDQIFLEDIEKKVNEKIFEKLDINVVDMDIEEAKKSNVKMFFSEKYGKIVRVVKIGNYSTELCCGTHAKNTRDIGIFKIISEESVASGIRRITAVTSEKAYLSFFEERKVIDNITKRTSISKDNLEKYIDNLLLLKKKLKKINLDLAKNISSSLANIIKNHNNIHIAIVQKIKNDDRDILVNISNFLLEYINSQLFFNHQKYLIILIEDMGRGSFLSIDTNCDEGADFFIKKICEVFGGKGGGNKLKSSGQTNTKIIDEEKIDSLIKEYFCCDGIRWIDLIGNKLWIV